MFVRFINEGVPAYGVVKDEKVFLINGDIFKDDYEISEVSFNLKDIQLLAPCTPSKVVCVGLNYTDHAREVNLSLPEQPLLFLKPSTSVIGPNDEVVYPDQSDQVDYEAELAIVIKKKAKNISEEDVSGYILGFTCANDVTARDIQFSDGQWTRGKSFDTFCPIGPGITDSVDLKGAKIELEVDGEIRQQSSLDQLIFKVDYLVSYISKVMTLNPGDVILTGTPHGVGPVIRNNRMTVRIEGIGELENIIV